MKGEVTNENMPSNIHDIIINQDDTIHKHHLSKVQRTKNNLTPDAATTITDHHHNFLDNSYNDDDGIVNPSPNGSNQKTHGIIQDLLEHSSIKRVGITTTSSCNVSSSSSSSELHHYDSNNKNSIINQVKNSSSNKNNNSTFQKSKGSSMPPISVSTKNNNNKIPTGRMDVVTLDRPSHWMKSSLKPTATTALKFGSSSSNRRGGGGHISPMRKKVSTGHPQSSWNRPKDNTTTPSTAAASVAAVAQPAVISLDNISTLCFRPSWMVSPPTTTSTSSSTMTRMIKNNNFASSSAGDGRCEAMRTVDAIQEDDFDDHTNHQQHNNSHHHQQHRSSFNDTFSPDRTISSHHHHHQNSSSKKNDSFSLKFNSSSSSSSALSKAKPGSLKAKLLKIFREVDSIDTWMRNFSSLGHKPMERDSTNRGSSIDLQDPRNRAMHYIEFEVIQKLTDRYPFQVYLMRVLNSWHHHHHARDKSSTSRVLDEQLLAQESGMQDCLNASMFNNPTSSDELYKEGSDVVGYFTGSRDNGCGNNTVGSSKALAEGLCIRIYEPYVMPFVNRLKAMETIVMCTSFWEILVA